MATAQQVLDVARGELGVTEYPPNSNKVKYWDAYAPYWNGEPWCDRFVSWCGWRVGAPVGVFDYCPYHVNWFKQQGRWIDRSGIPQPGDIVFFANKGTACHVGIVEQRNNSSNITTIEGNTSSTNNANGGRVERRTRTYGSVGSSWYILGFGRPNYEEDDMPSAQEVADAVWNKQFANSAGSYPAFTYLTQTNQNTWEIKNEIMRTDDPSGREVHLKDHDHIKWLASVQAQQTKMIQAIMDHLGIGEDDDVKPEVTE